MAKPVHSKISPKKLAPDRQGTYQSDAHCRTNLFPAKIVKDPKHSMFNTRSARSSWLAVLSRHLKCSQTFHREESCTCPRPGASKQDFWASMRVPSWNKSTQSTLFLQTKAGRTLIHRASCNTTLMFDAFTPMMKRRVCDERGSTSRKRLSRTTQRYSICFNMLQGFKCRVSDSRKFGHSWTIEKLTVRSHTDSFFKNILPQVPQSMICIYIDVSVMVVMSVMLCSLCLFLSFSAQEWHTKLTKPIKLHQMGKCCLTSAIFFVVKILRFGSHKNDVNEMNRNERNQCQTKWHFNVMTLFLKKSQADKPSIHVRIPRQVLGATHRETTSLCGFKTKVV